MRRGSIARWMLAVVLASSDCCLLREWSSPDNRFGFLGLYLSLVLAIGAVWLVMVGSGRRFVAAAGLASAILWVAVLVWPDEILDPLTFRCLIPVLGAGANASFEFQSVEGWATMDAWLRSGLHEINPRHDGLIGYRTRCLRGLIKQQVGLLISLASLGFLAGSIAVVIRTRRTSQPTPGGP